MALSFMVHIAVIAELRADPAVSFFNANPAFDSFRFQQEADIISSEGFYAFSGKRQQSPLYPLALSGFSRLSGPFPAAMLVFQALLNIAALYMMYRLAAEWFGPDAALVTLFFAAFYQGLVFHAAVFLRESLVLFLSVLSAFLLARCGGKNIFLPAAAGGAIGLLAATRPYPLCLAAGLLWILAAGLTNRNALAKGLAYAAGVLAVSLVLPPPGGGDPLGGIAHFLSGNVLDGAYGYIWASTPEKERLLAASNGSYASAAWLVIKEIAAHPVAYALFYLKKARMLAGDFEIPSNYNIYLFREELSRGLNAAFVSFGMFAPFAMVGVAASLRDRRLAGFFIWGAAVVIGVYIFPIQERYRLMAAPVFLIMAGHGLAHLYRLAAAGEMKRTAYAAAIFLGALLFCRFDHSPLPSAVDAEDYANLSLAHQQIGDDARARYYRLLAEQKASARGIPVKMPRP